MAADDGGTDRGVEHELPRVEVSTRGVAVQQVARLLPRQVADERGGWPAGRGTSTIDVAVTVSSSCGSRIVKWATRLPKKSRRSR